MSHDTVLLIEKFRNSGLGQQEFCIKHSLSLSTLKYHLRKFAANKTANPGGFISLAPAPASFLNQNSSVIIIRGRFTPDEIGRIIASSARS
jgi:hypothetical protein